MQKSMDVQNEQCEVGLLHSIVSCCGVDLPIQDEQRLAVRGGGALMHDGQDNVCNASRRGSSATRISAGESDTAPGIRRRKAMLPSAAECRAGGLS